MLSVFQRGNSRESLRARWPAVAVLALAVLMLGTVMGCNPSAQAPKVVRIGYLETSGAAPTTSVVEAFRRGLRDNGWEEGRNLSIELRFAEGNEARLPILVRELLDLHVDLIFAATTQATRETLDATSTIPVVFAGLADPVGAGIVKDPSHPGGNATGTSLMTAHLHGRQLQLLKESVPSLSRVAVLLNPTGPSASSLDLLEDAAAAVGIQPLVLRVNTMEEVATSLDRAVTQGAGAVIALPDALFFNERPRMIRLAAERSLPDMYWERTFVEDGGLMSYGGNRAEAFRRATGYVDKILKGARPGDLPVEQSSQFEFLVGTAAQQRLGITIPPAVAEEVTEWV